MTRDCVIMMHDEDGPSYVSIGPKSQRWSFASRGRVKAHGRNHNVIMYEGDKRAATRLNYYEARRILNRLKKERRGWVCAFSIRSAGKGI